LAAELGVELVALDGVFHRADFVSISCPLSTETHHLVERRASGADETNTARGPIVAPRPRPLGSQQINLLAMIAGPYAAVDYAT